MTSEATVASEARYRTEIEWDAAKWVTHCVNCSPGNCPFRAYIKDGRVLREEQSGTLPVIEPGVPDMNPMGCQKGAAWSRTLDAPTRIPYPMRRKGARGGGEWERISWDDALTQIADTMIDTIEQSGPGGHPPCRHRRRGRAHRRLPVREADQSHRRDEHGHEWRHRRLQRRDVPDVRAGGRDQQLRRLVPQRRAAHLAPQPGLHRHPALPLHRRSAISGRRGRDDRAGLQPVGDARGLLRRRAARHRCGAGAGDGARCHRRRADGRDVRPLADGPAAAGAQRHRPVLARRRRRGGRPRGPVLRVVAGGRRDRACVARGARGERGCRARRRVYGRDCGRRTGRGAAGVRSVCGSGWRRIRRRRPRQSAACMPTRSAFWRAR